MNATANIDGACDVHSSCRGGWGVSLRLEDGRLVEEFGHVPAPTTNNCAEYAGLLAALALAHDLGVSDLTSSRIRCSS